MLYHMTENNLINCPSHKFYSMRKSKRMQKRRKKSN